jgi:hypothetical protein
VPGSEGKSEEKRRKVRTREEGLDRDGRGIARLGRRYCKMKKQGKEEERQTIYVVW